MTPVFGNHARGTVTALIVEGANLVVLSAHHDRTLAGQLETVVVAGTRDIRDVRNEHPVA